MYTSDSSYQLDIHRKLKKSKNWLAFYLSIVGIFALLMLGFYMVIGGIQELIKMLNGQSQDWLTSLIISIFLTAPAPSLILIIFRTIQELINYKKALVNQYRVVLIDPKKFRNESEQEIYQLLDQIAKYIGILTPELGIYEDRAVNAFAYSISSKKSVIALSSTLLKSANLKDKLPTRRSVKFSKKEVAAILSHELGHIYSGDSLATTLLDVMGKTLHACLVTPWKAILWLFFLVKNFFQEFMRSSGYRSASGIQIFFVALSLWLFTLIFYFIFWLIYTIGQIAYITVFQIFQCAFSRHREYIADAIATLLIDKESVISMLTKFQELEAVEPINMAFAIRSINNNTPFLGDGKFNINKTISRFTPQAYRTHPPILKRIEAIQKGTYIPS